jgi:hypothetical protein
MERGGGRCALPGTLKGDEIGFHQETLFNGDFGRYVKESSGKGHFSP